jgi:D-serine deaminase-like pyridoxal phosphate-dependent protein
VVSAPEPGFALLDGGKRDFPYDEGMPVTPLGTVEKLNDQHAYLRSDRVEVGQVVRLGLSHPCTAFDKWRLIPVVDDADGSDPVVVDLVQTFF